jgi:hypothetical protein
LQQLFPGRIVEWQEQEEATDEAEEGEPSAGSEADTMTTENERRA